MNADGTSQTRLTNNIDHDMYPSWSPDGTKIAFVTEREHSVSWTQQIYIMNADGTSQTNISNNYNFDSFPNWSPDGTKIAFTSKRDGNNEIYIMNADGTSQTRITNSIDNDIFPDWSPDGTKIAIAGDTGQSYSDIYVMNTDGSARTNISHNSYSYSKSDWIQNVSAPKDTDKDGIPDSSDSCPTQAETVNGYQDTDGCPDVVPIKDTIPPVIVVPNNMAIQATSNNPSPVAFSVSATDDKDGSVIPICSPKSGSNFAVGTTTVSCTVTDIAGNVGKASFTVTVIPFTPDIISPVVIVPQNITVNLNNTSVIPTPVKFSVTSTDNVGVVMQSCTPASDSAFSVGTTTVSCTATDKAGNVGKASFTVTINKFISIPKDTDGDGISDSTDKCPTQAETVNGFQDTDGCPDVVPSNGHLNSQMTCTSLVAGTWDETSKTCTLPLDNITIKTGETLTIDSGYTLVVRTLLHSSGIVNVGTIVNDGKIIISSADRSNDGYGIWKGTIINNAGGVITISNTKGTGIYGSNITNNAGGVITISNTKGTGIYGITESKIENKLGATIVDVRDDFSSSDNNLNNSGVIEHVPPTDTDKDGIPDSSDSCPTQAETVNGFQDTDGCPDVVPPTDTDGDGISDSTDKCPTQAETVNGFQDTDGCPDKSLTPDLIKTCGEGTYLVNGVCKIRPDQIKTSTITLTSAEPKIVDSNNKPVSIIKANDHLFVNVGVENLGKQTEKFVGSYRYIQASTGKWSEWTWVSASVNAGKYTNISIPWSPTMKDSYEFDIQIWDNEQKKNKISSEKLTVNVMLADTKKVDEIKKVDDKKALADKKVAEAKKIDDAKRAEKIKLIKERDAAKKAKK